MTAPHIDYSTVTEVPGTMVSREAIDMVLTRYTFAAEFCRGKHVLEVACGPGPGLGFLAGHAARVVAGDYTESLLGRAQSHYGGRVPLVRLDAGALPFADGTFDVVVLFEAIYFLPDVPSFLASCRRVLRSGGTVIIATVNPELDAFNPSPNATRYWSADGLAALCAAHGFQADLFAAFEAFDPSMRGRAMAMLKRVAVKFHLIPQTMKGKELLKRLAFGTLEPFPAEVTSASGAYHPPVAMPDRGRAGGFKVIYAVARMT